VNTPTKIRLLNHLRYIFPVWTSQRQALVIERAFDSDLAQAKGWEERQAIAASRDSEAREFWNAAAAFRSRQLVNRAQKLYIDTSSLEWEEDQYANHWLKNAAQAKLNHVVVEETRKTWEFRLKLIGGFIGALTGLAGTIIGLIAIWKKK
jgi:hypothetical protein